MTPVLQECCHRDAQPVPNMPTNQEDAMSEHTKPVARDVASNNAGTEDVMGKPTAEQTWEDYREMFDVNVAGVLSNIQHESATCSATPATHWPTGPASPTTWESA
jgi:NAD(P)-dependent dehydrogenase (short-subunit alcohol dehydrogenase family)